tara:strand:+ start:723 stop:1142 length:420 start_codon:yes stop_codon:yes gene_type:complete
MKKTTYDYPVTYRPDLLKVISRVSVAALNNQVPCVSTSTLSKAQAGAARKAQARWDAHTTGNPYVLYVQPRSYDQKPFRVQAYGKNVYQAVRRYYRGMDKNCNWKWQCTKVVAVYSCVNDRVAKGGKLLHGQAQDRAPW